MSATPRPRRLLALLLGLTVLLAPGTAAAKGDDPAGAEDGGGTTATAGDFAVTVNGRTTNPAPARRHDCATSPRPDRSPSAAGT